jgi:hypothetical protein
MRINIVILLLFFYQSFFAQVWSEATPFASPCGQSQSGYQGGVTKLVEYNNELYASGNFIEAGGLISNCIARWNGISWNTLYQGDLFQNNIITDIIVFNNKLYISGGILLTWDGTTIDTIQYLDPTTGNPMNIGGTSFCIYNTELYYGTSSGIYRITVNNDVTYEEISDISFVSALEVFNGILYAGGIGVYQNINGSWTSVTGNTYPLIRDLKTFENNLYTLGDFNSIGLVTAHHFAKYDGQSWSSENLFPNIYLMNSAAVDAFTSSALNVINNSLILTYPTNYNGLLANVFAKQNGVWSEIGSFIPPNYIVGQCYASCLFQNEIFVGGAFGNGIPGPQTICNLMKIGSSVLGLSDNEDLSKIQIDENNQFIQIESQLPLHDLKILESSGKVVNLFNSNEHNLKIDISKLNPGTYFLILNSQESFLFTKY